jgi:hypothetical protein
MFIHNKILLASAVLFASLATKSHAGLFDLSDYFSGGNLTQSTGFIDFVENGNVSTNFDSGDYVIFLQDFASLGGVSVNGSAPMPSAVYGVTVFQAGTTTDHSTGTGFFATTIKRTALQAVGSSAFTSVLNGLGVDTSNLEVTIDNNTTFALLSSGSDVALNSNGTTNFSTFEVDLVAGLTGSATAATEWSHSSGVFDYGFYDTVNTSDGFQVFTFRYGMNVTSTDSSFAGVGSVTATDYDGGTSQVSIALQFEPATSQAKNYGDVSTTAAYYGAVQASLLTGSSVPEPGSMLILASVAGVGMLSSRRRRG